MQKILRERRDRLCDGTISSDWLDTFRLGYEFVRDEIGKRHDYLQRNAGGKAQAVVVAIDDNAAVVKTARTA